MLKTKATGPWTTSFLMAFALQILPSVGTNGGSLTFSKLLLFHSSVQTICAWFQALRRVASELRLLHVQLNSRLISFCPEMRRSSPFFKQYSHKWWSSCCRADSRIRKWTKQTNKRSSQNAFEYIRNCSFSVIILDNVFSMHSTSPVETCGLGLDLERRIIFTRINKDLNLSELGCVLCLCSSSNSRRPAGDDSSPKSATKTHYVTDTANFSWRGLSGLQSAIVDDDRAPTRDDGWGLHGLWEEGRTLNRSACDSRRILLQR